MYTHMCIERMKTKMLQMMYSCHNSPQQEGRILRHNPQCPSGHWERQQNNLKCFILVRLKNATDAQGLNPDEYQVNAKWSEDFSADVKCTGVNTNTHTGTGSIWNSDWCIFVSVPWKRSPLAEGLLPPELGLTQHWHRRRLSIDQNGLSNSSFCLSNWVAGWRCSSNVITLYKSYLFGVGFLMG